MCSVELSQQGFFLVSSEAEIRPLSQWDLGDFFPYLKKNSQIPNLKIFFFFFLFFRIFIQSPHTHSLTSYMMTIYWNCILFSFNLMAIVCVIANFVFKLTKKCCSCLFRKFPKIVVYRANFPNLKGPRAPSQNCQKKSLA